MDNLQRIANEMCRRRVLGGEDSDMASNAVYRWLTVGKGLHHREASKICNTAERLAVAERDGFCGDMDAVWLQKTEVL